MASTNQTTFGIVKADILAFYNPGYDYNGVILGNGDSGIAGTGAGGNLTWTVATAAWPINRWQGWKLLVSGTYYTIASNTATVLTLSSGDLTAAGAVAWSITHERVTMTQAEFDALVLQAVGQVQGEIPERYRRMIYEIDGEIITERATAAQTSASLSYAPAPTTSLILWRNFRALWETRRRNSALVEGATADYTQSGTTLTFVNALNEDDEALAEYDHELTTVPPMLERLGLLKVCINLYQQIGVAIESVAPLYEDWAAEYTRLIDGLRAGTMGIAEFDKIKLYKETRAPEASAGGGYSQVEGYR